MVWFEGPDRCLCVFLLLLSLVHSSSKNLACKVGIKNITCPKLNSRSLTPSQTCSPTSANCFRHLDFTLKPLVPSQTPLSLSNSNHTNHLQPSPSSKSVQNPNPLPQSLPHSISTWAPTSPLTFSVGASQEAGLFCQTRNQTVPLFFLRPSTALRSCSKWEFSAWPDLPPQLPLSNSAISPSCSLYWPSAVP